MKMIVHFVLLLDSNYVAMSSLGIWIQRFDIMMLGNMQISELLSRNRGQRGRILCVTSIHFFFVKNQCVGEYIFFLYWPWNHVFAKSRYLKRRPF